MHTPPTTRPDIPTRPNHGRTESTPPRRVTRPGSPMHPQSPPAHRAGSCQMSKEPQQCHERAQRKTAAPVRSACQIRAAGCVLLFASLFHLNENAHAHTAQARNVRRVHEARRRGIRPNLPALGATRPRGRRRTVAAYEFAASSCLSVASAHGFAAHTPEASKSCCP